MFIGGFGAYIERIKSDTAKEAYNASVMNHFVAFLSFAASFSCEIIIAVSILTSAVNDLYKFAELLLFARLFVQTFPTWFFIADFLSSESDLKPLIDTSNIFQASSTYGPLIFLSFFEGSLLTYLPWCKSDFCDFTKGYPNVRLFRLCLVFKFVHSILTFIAHVGSMVITGFTGNTFSIFVLINIGISAVKLILALIQAVLKWGVLTTSLTPKQTPQAAGSTNTATISPLSTDGVQLQPKTQGAPKEDV